MPWVCLLTFLKPSLLFIIARFCFLTSQYFLKSMHYMVFLTELIHDFKQIIRKLFVRCLRNVHYWINSFNIHYWTYWIRPCLQMIPIYFLIDNNTKYLFQAERKTSARGSIDNLFRRKAPLIVIMK